MKKKSLKTILLCMVLSISIVGSSSYAYAGIFDGITNGLSNLWNSFNNSNNNSSSGGSTPTGENTTGGGISNDSGLTAQNIVNRFTAILKNDTFSSNQCSTMIDEKFNKYKASLEKLGNLGYVVGGKDGQIYKGLEENITNKQAQLKTFLCSTGETVDEQMEKAISDNTVWIRSPESFVDIYNEIAYNNAIYYTAGAAKRNDTLGVSTEGASSTDNVRYFQNGTYANECLTSLDSVAENLYKINNTQLINDISIGELQNNSISNYYNSNGSNNREHCINTKISFEQSGCECDECGGFTVPTEAEQLEKLQQEIAATGKTNVFGYTIHTTETCDVNHGDQQNPEPCGSTKHRINYYIVEYPILLTASGADSQFQSLITNTTGNKIKLMKNGLGINNQAIQGSTTDGFNTVGDSATYTGTGGDGGNDIQINAGLWELDGGKSSNNDLVALATKLKEYEEKTGKDDEQKEVGQYIVDNFYKEKGSETENKLETGDVYAISSNKTPDINLKDKEGADSIARHIVTKSTYDYNAIDGNDYLIQIYGVPMVALRVRELNPEIISQFGDALLDAEDEGYTEIKTKNTTCICATTVRIEYIESVGVDGDRYYIKTSGNDCETFYDLKGQKLVRNGLALSEDVKKELGKAYDAGKSFKVSKNGNLLLLDYLALNYEPVIKTQDWIAIGRKFRIKASNIKSGHSTNELNEYDIGDATLFGQWVDSNGVTINDDAATSVSLTDFCDKGTYLQNTARVKLTGAEASETNITTGSDEERTRRTTSASASQIIPGGTSPTSTTNNIEELGTSVKVKYWGVFETIDEYDEGDEGKVGWIKESNGLWWYRTKRNINTGTDYYINNGAAIIKQGEDYLCYYFDENGYLSRKTFEMGNTATLKFETDGLQFQIGTGAFILLKNERKEAIEMRFKNICNKAVDDSSVEIN